ncbi:MAG: MoaD family protein [Candidatus Aminicenantes bacterium]|nr:MoaD family protein [Candidatus Aminicenantes bacterium]
MAGKIAVKFYALLRRRLGTSTVHVEADGLTVLELLRRVEKQAGRPFLDEFLDRERGLLAGTMILVNGENVRLKAKLETLVHAGDTMDLFSPVGGG